MNNNEVSQREAAITLREAHKSMLYRLSHEANLSEFAYAVAQAEARQPIPAYYAGLDTAGEF